MCSSTISKGYLHNPVFVISAADTHWFGGNRKVQRSSRKYVILGCFYVDIPGPLTYKRPRRPRLPRHSAAFQIFKEMIWFLGPRKATCLEASADGVSKRTRGDFTVARPPLLFKATLVNEGNSISLLKPISLHARARTYVPLASIKISK